MDKYFIILYPLRKENPSFVLSLVFSFLLPFAFCIFTLFSHHVSSIILLSFLLLCPACQSWCLYSSIFFSLRYINGMYGKKDVQFSYFTVWVYSQIRLKMIYICYLNFNFVKRKTPKTLFYD